ncbi:MAG: tRNA (adenosine(37)-N6)-threonylcarbamoyltransferase complex transferase subunit TsaD [Pseudomonadota bacterium]|uniref:tRNA N6-adenosine threonylcarbamoyltransferase n=1 Tax=Candidatus Desulfatibia profunda TaxID=2841695 RepID=A0A8J6NUH7_9BACT|nr:tRNA (adenosine(37)-N6)-threonylcarbamoyltransferase complex transferase subunit TsaD [Candidatus Desulfatibia profunda]MBL7179261.1 tRNA (adenosine(37)-N6)-threonylcarbamoyltransferase complex transferase subunit TsaD [Desulfobacterales bacterium]
MIILGIETSCDDTAAAVVADGKLVLSSVVSSQIAIHQPYGGVVPELASRKHIEAIVPVVNEAVSASGLDADQLNAVAVTSGPGLVGALLVGFCFAKAYAYMRGLPWVGVNHLEGHINSVFLGADPPPFPFVALLVSGGHTSIYHVTSHTTMELLGQTRDDAAGEAFDKVAKMLDLGYPGGMVIDRLAKQGDPGRIVFTRPFLEKSVYDFSFSGLKTAVKRYIQVHRDDCAGRIPDIVAGFQEAVVDVLSYKLIHAAVTKDCNHIALVGGVAANSRLREKVRHAAGLEGMTVHIPSIELCSDNAAMIAAMGYHYLTAGRVSGLGDDVFSRAKTG